MDPKILHAPALLGAVFSAFVLTMPAALAATNQAPVPLVAAAPAPENVVPKSPVAKPLSAWLVGPSQASNFDLIKDPDQQGCLMVSEYDNGMILGMHARAAGIVGMTVDTKQNTMSAGDTQSVSLNIGHDSYVLDAAATDASTLAISFDKAGGGRNVAERLTGLGNFRLLINKTPYYFATTGFTDGLARLQTCMGGIVAVNVPVTGPVSALGSIKYADMDLETMRVTSTGTNTPLAMALTELVPAGYRFKLQGVDPMQPISWQAGDDWVSVMRGALGPLNLKVLIKDHTVYIGQRVDNLGPVVDLSQADDAREVAEVKAIPPRTVADIDGLDANPENPEGIWDAAKGENLADVLKAWGAMAGIKVKADLEGQLRLPRNVNYEGSFNEAVQKLLALFNGSNRPVGRYLGNSLSSAFDSPAPVAVMARPAPAYEAPTSSVLRTQSNAPKWQPSTPAELKALAKEAEAKWGAGIKVPVEQMDVVPDPIGAPGVVKSKAKTKIASLASGNTSWKALEGTPLRDVLGNWASQAGVKMVWQSKYKFPLPNTIVKQGAFQDALMAVLASYPSKGTHPVAQLNSDPKTGEKVLILNAK